MSEARDRELGRRLAELPVPDHGPGFWSDLEARLAEETIDELAERRARRARRGRFGLTTLTVAAAVAVVVGLVVARAPDERADRRVTTTPTTDAAPQPVPRMVTGVATIVEGTTADRLTQRFSFTRAIDGSYATTNEATGETMAYDAASARTISWFTYEGRTQAAVETNVAPGAPDRYSFSFLGGHDLEDFVTAAGEAGIEGVEEGEVGGRSAWIYDGPVRENELAGTGVDAVEAAVDRETGVLLHLVERAGDDVLREITVSGFEEHDEIDRTRTAPAPPPGAAVDTNDERFLRRDLTDPPEVDGWTFEGAWWTTPCACEVDPTGAEASNPPSRDVEAVVFSDGWRRVVVTTRAAEGGQEWDDPFRGEGQVFERSSEWRSPDGHAGEIVLDPLTVPHLWGVSSSEVVTAAGAASPAELTALAGSSPWR